MSKKKEDFFDDDFWYLIGVVAFTSFFGIFNGEGYLVWFFIGFGGLVGILSTFFLFGLLLFVDVYGRGSYTLYSEERIKKEKQEKKINFLRAFTGIVLGICSLGIGLFLLFNNITICRLLGLY